MSTWASPRVLGHLAGTALFVGAAVAVTTTASTAASGSARLPAALVRLERRMERLSVASERYQAIIDASGTAGVEECASISGGGTRCRRYKRHTTSHSRSVGLASVSPPEAEVLNEGSSGKQRVITIGTTEYEYLPECGDEGRPWVMRTEHVGAPVYPFEPVAGESPHRGGGAYAGIIKLLATAQGRVRNLGRVSVDGHTTTEFAALRNASETPWGRALQRVLVFITAAGLPLRVVENTHIGSSTVNARFDILATNLPPPVDITAPPASMTRPESNHASCSPGTA